LAINTSVRAIVDPAEMQDYITRVKADAALQDELIQKDQERQTLEKNIFTLKEQLQKASPEQRDHLRAEMSEALKKMHNFENQPTNLREHTKNTLQNVKRGMTLAQVLKIAGPPDEKVEVKGDPRFRYGIVWLIFENGRVTCAVKQPHFRPKMGCRDYHPNQKVYQ
jgi:hypothetical protein